MTRTLAFYSNAFTNLRRDAKKGGAPHKPILILSLIDAFEHHFYENNKIVILPELIGFFKSNWSKYVESNHDLRFALPFYHLATEPFWKLIPKAGCELWVQSKGAMKSLGNLEIAIEYAQIDEELAVFFKEQTNRMVLRQLIMEKYFPNAIPSPTSHEGIDMIEVIKKQIIEDDRTEYLNTIKALKARLDKEAFEEEIILRSSIFKREIPKNYDYTCCISNFRVEVPFNSAILIEACHIEPFSVSYNDTLKNGITLTPTLHKAFDRGLITISDDYKVIVSNKFSETVSPQSLKRYHGKQILLPQNVAHYPNIENLYWHRKNIFER